MGAMRPSPVPTVDVREAARRLREQPAAGVAPLLVDVRERPEFAARRVPGAALIPMSEFAARHAELPRDRGLLVMCAHGQRSFVAAQYLAGAGYGDVASVDGGIVAWHEAGFPTAEGPPRPDEGRLPSD